MRRFFSLESSNLEFKRCVETRHAKHWLKTVSAFANDNGGSIVWGVEDDGVICGVEDAQRDAERISSLIEARISPLPRFHLHAQFEGRMVVLVLNVKKGHMPPYYYRANGHREAYVRAGNITVPASDQILNELILRGAHCSYDALISDVRLEGQRFRALRHHYKQRTIRDFSEEDFVSFGLASEEGYLSNAGCLLADDPLVPHARLVCTRWEGMQKGEATDEACYSGSLIEQLHAGQNFYPPPVPG